MGKIGAIVLSVFVSSGFASSIAAQSGLTTQVEANVNIQRPELRVNRELVRRVQRSLANRGYYGGAVDGLVGPQTMGALRDFQRAEGLPVTGHLDEETIEKLGVQIEEERPQSKDRGLLGKAEMGVKTTEAAVVRGVVTAGKAAKDGAVTAAKATGKGATTAGKATAKGATVVGEKTAVTATTIGQSAAIGATKVGSATVRGTAKAGARVKQAITRGRSDEEILYDVQDALRSEPGVDLSALDIEVTDGAVTLSLRRGKTTNVKQAIAVAKRIKGVKKVVAK